MLRGSVTVEGPACLPGGEATGVMNDDRVDIGVVGTGAEATYTGTVSGGTASMSGTYTTTCGDTGTWEATRP